MKRGKQTTRQIFAIPVALAVLSVIGLVSALTGDGVRDFLSWLALIVPVAAVAWAMKKRRA